MLPKELAEKLVIEDDLTVWSTDDGDLDSEYINEVEYVRLYEN